MYFNVYAYDGNFLKNWLDDELNFTNQKSTLIKCNDDNNDDDTEISTTCHRHKLEIHNCPTYFNIIDCMYSIDTKFEYLSMAGSLVVNREVDRCLFKKSIWQ